MSDAAKRLRENPQLGEDAANEIAALIEVVRDLVDFRTETSVVTAGHYLRLGEALAAVERKLGQP